MLISTKIVQKQIDMGRVHFEKGTIEIRATYLFGSHPRNVGKLISVMGGNYDGNQRMVKLTNGEVMIRDHTYRGLHIGSFMFNMIIKWAKELDPTYSIKPITLSIVDARDENAKLRRNFFYEKAGIKFNYIESDGISKASGTSDPALSIQDLIWRGKISGIKPSSMLDGFDNLCNEFHILRMKADAARRGFRFRKAQQRKIDWWMRAIASYLNWPLCVFFTFVAYSIGRWFR